MSTVYALLVGIDDYQDVPKLSGCLKDIEAVYDFLEANFDRGYLKVRALTNAEATRAAIIDGFRSHLSQANADDIALFYFCGHGAQSPTAAEFKAFSPDGKEEGLVCYDSRAPGNFDLADKELAVLIDELAARTPHVTIVLDCCHSGSGTRDIDDDMLVTRMTGANGYKRSLGDYLDGHYAAQVAAGQGLSIPAASHVVMSACRDVETAKEMPGKGGVFTASLLKALAGNGGHLSYYDLMIRCRDAVRDFVKAQDRIQNPEFEAFGNASLDTGFLGRRPRFDGRRYAVGHANGVWSVTCGTIDGLSGDADKVAFILYREDDPSVRGGPAAAIDVGGTRTTIDFAGDPAVRYRAEIASAPMTKLTIGFRGESAIKAALVAAVAADPLSGVAIAEAGNGYALAISGAELLLANAAGVTLQRTPLDPAQLDLSAQAMLGVLKRIARWEAMQGRQNPRTRLDPDSIDLIYAESVPGGDFRVHKAGSLTLSYSGTKLRGAIKVRNHGRAEMSIGLFYLSSDFGIQKLDYRRIRPGEDHAILWGAGADEYFELLPGSNDETDVFKLIVSSEDFDVTPQLQKPLRLGGLTPLPAAERRIGNADSADGDESPLAGDWFAIDLRVRLVRQLDAIGPEPTSLADGGIVIKGHRNFTAGIGLSSLSSNTRAVGNPAFLERLAAAGITPLDLAGTRDAGNGRSANVIELRGIGNAAALAEQPLEITVNAALEPDEALLPVFFDGEFVLPAGDYSTDENGNGRVRISAIPAGADAGADERSLVGAVKLFLLKTYLKKTDTNQLRWVSYAGDGTPTRRSDDIAAKVAAAGRILLLVHGIIGDTQGMAAGVREAGIDGGFDLVLTYDYENLSTPIEQTARQLKDDLAAIGLGAGHGKQITALVHSMGGLVTRWLIEREGGNAMIGHLVMCGTPNQGSPLGKVDGARRLLKLATEIALNFIPVIGGYVSNIAKVLDYSEKLTPTLEQMNPVSDFIKALNASPDPGVRYTILAGDIDAYEAHADPMFSRLMVRVGRGALFDLLFGNQPNDIAVGVGSIDGVSDARSLPPQRHKVDCHHLNYFAAPAGLVALKSVDWRDGQLSIRTL